MNIEFFGRIEGRHCEIVPGDGSHYVLVDGKPWIRFDDLHKAEALRALIVERWAAEYDQRALEYEQSLEHKKPPGSPSTIRNRAANLSLSI